MSKFNNSSIIPRYTAFVIVMALLAIAVVVKAGYIMTAKRTYWQQVNDRVKRDSVPISPTRGNILSCDGQILASSLPEYNLFVDFDAMHNSKVDEQWAEKEDSICNGLHEIFPDKSAEEFRTLLRDGKKNLSKRCQLWKKRVNYITYSRVKELPIFRLSSYKGGFYTEEFDARVRPNGDGGARTVGSMYGAKDTARCGIELSYDSLLRGQNGLMHRRKVLNKFLSIVDAPAIDGADIVTTLDVNMQDIAEKALLDELKLPEVNGEMGVAILMEVETGDVKAIVNLTKCADGEYREIMNNAISYTCEPGSVFKPASVMVALDEGVVDTSYVINTGGGVYDMHGSPMRDHNWRKGGYGSLNLARAIEVSSNIGISYVTDHFFASDPDRYIQGLYRIGMHEDLKLPLQGYHAPVIKSPTATSTGKVQDKTMLPWMSIGYRTQIAPINTLAFYNAIANGGKMVRPRFVKSVRKDGNDIITYPTEVIKDHICKESTLNTMQTLLRHVVTQGLGKKAGSKLFDVSGKTGTALVAQPGGYKGNGTCYWLSFAGYFGAKGQKPKYSCIVCIKKWNSPASGGGMSGVVFRQIAESVMAQDIASDLSQAKPEGGSTIPYIKPGNILATDYALSTIGFQCRTDWNGTFATGDPIWGVADVDKKGVVDFKREPQKDNSSMPDVKGMGASDAVYLLESRGLKVRLSGRGKVKTQSIAPGTTIKKGTACQLTLSLS